jgi:hypothetical protein
MRLTRIFLIFLCFSCAGCNVNSLLGIGGGKKTVTVAVTPKTQSVVVSAQQQFSAVVTGSSDQAVVWSVGGTNCSTQDCGAISASGLYTAPKTVPSPALIAVTATANANALDFGAAAVTIITAPAAAVAMLRATYTFLLSGVDTEGPLSVAGTFVADGSGRLSDGELRVCREQTHCADQIFAGTAVPTTAGAGTFEADVLPNSKFSFSPTENGVLELQLAGPRNLRASGVLRPNSTPADSPQPTN